MKEKIYKYLKRRKAALTIAAIALALSADKETVRRNVRALVREGALRHTADSTKYDARYEVTGTLAQKVSAGLPVIKVPVRRGDVVSGMRGMRTAHLCEFLHAPYVIRMTTRT